MYKQNQNILKEDMEDKREIFIKRLKEDLIGPLKEDEILESNPLTTYLNGILYPSNLNESDENDDEVETFVKDSDTRDESRDKIVNNKIKKPSTMGISFCLDPKKNKELTVDLTINLGIYKKIIKKNEDEEKKNSDNYKREAIKHVQKIKLSKKSEWVKLKNDKLDKLQIWYEKKNYDNLSHVTFVLVNCKEWKYGIDSKIEKIERSFFQTSFELFSSSGFEARPRSEYNSEDSDEKIYELIYRNNRDYASGFNCTSEWEAKDKNVNKIRAVWMAEENIYSVSPQGDTNYYKKGEELSTNFLINENTDSIKSRLNNLINSYKKWISNEQGKINNLDKSLQSQARKNISSCNLSVKRMEKGIEKLLNDKNAMQAFRFANEAIQKQHFWKKKDNSKFSWRPFQIGFFLLNLESLIDQNSEDRDFFDLLWFPTGGGKTEAYLFISIFLIFYSRLDKNFHNTNGTQIIMRYTLRVLTVDQFNRISAIICAAEILRKKNEKLLGNKSISIGLWVGDNQSPNKYSDAKKAIESSSDFASTPKLLKECPCCGKDLQYSCDDDNEEILIECVSPETRDICEIQKKIKILPVSTTDECLYRKVPTFLLATIDKFAQIARKDEALRFFGIKGFSTPPSLIIQDELHLITGPLGSLTALYETAIDHLCFNNNQKIKIIGSTATIKSASSQVSNLFNRKSFQFPPAGIDHENSFFSKTDHDSFRKYIAVSSNGTSEKYLLQWVAASLLQSLLDKKIDNKNFINNYGTVIAYFNSLKILSSAEPMMNEQVRDTLKVLQNKREENSRLDKFGPPEELSGRKKSSEIPEIRNKLKKLNFGDPGFIDVVLATNMISVGIDIEKLNIMVVNGQPKTMSEYIQATSRVGRSKSSGIVVSLYNHAKIRDRNRYESFSYWHKEIYKGVENSSVTPFSPNARDKALHVLLIILCKSKLGIKNPKEIKNNSEKVKNEIFPIILNKIKKVDPEELADAENELKEFLDYWLERANTEELKYFWHHKKINESLLISFEAYAAKRASGSWTPIAKPTPNSMRDVEPGVEYLCKETAKNKYVEK